jgi:CelD/BcsL family acetyltransferase involved in cellulose biosynthesis
VRTPPLSRPEATAVEEVQGPSGFAALAREWDACLREGPVDQPFARHGFLGAWLAAFEPPGRLRVLVARDAAGRAMGMAPLVEERRAGLTILAAPANDHSCRVEWVLGREPARAVEVLWGYLRDRLRWDVLLLRDVPRDGPTATALVAAAERDRHLVGRWPSLGSPFLALGRSSRDGRLTAKFLANLRRRARRLHELGSVSFRRVDGGAAEVEAFLGEFFALEDAGWKGRRGTSIARDGRLVAFYRGVAAAGAREGWLALRALDLDGRPAAMHFAFMHRGTYSLPKPAYDEALARCSPGQLLVREVLAECEARGLVELDFLGPDMPWKRDWAPEHRPHDWIHVYRPGLAGRALHALKHGLRPLAKEVLSWWRR